MTPKILRSWLNYKTAVRRAKSMSRGDLIDWIDTTGSDLVQFQNNYKRLPNGITSSMMKETSLALAVMCSELASRRISS